MEIRILSRSDVERALEPRAAVEAMRRAFAQISSGEAVVPVRGSVESALGTTLLMPAWLGGSAELGAKIVSVFPENPGRGLPAVTGAVLLLDAETGRPKALADGTGLTAIRTAAGSALAVELLADSGADAHAAGAGVLAVFGAGAQAEAHIRMLAALRPLREVRIVSRTLAGAEALAARLAGDAERLVPAGAGGSGPEVRALEDQREALAGAGLVVTATTSRTPVFDDADLEPGAHVSAVGSYLPDMQEIPPETVARARVIVDQREAAWEEAGDLIAPLRAGLVDRNVVAAELGEIVLGRAAPGREGHEVTLFKSVGNAAQDVAIAETALAEAERRDLGRLVPF